MKTTLILKSAIIWFVIILCTALNLMAQTNTGNQNTYNNSTNYDTRNIQQPDYNNPNNPAYQQGTIQTPPVNTFDQQNPNGVGNNQNPVNSSGTIQTPQNSTGNELNPNGNNNWKNPEDVNRTGGDTAVLRQQNYPVIIRDTLP